MPTLTDVINDITTQIVQNGTNDITADVLRPILLDMVNQINDIVGDLDDLDPSLGVPDDLVEAINTLRLQLLESIQDNSTSNFAGTFATYAALLAAFPSGGSAGDYAFLYQDEDLNDGLFEYRWNENTTAWEKETTVGDGSILMKVLSNTFEGGTALKFVWDQVDFLVTEVVGGGISIELADKIADFITTFTNDSYSGDRVGNASAYQGFEVRFDGDKSIGYRARNTSTATAAVVAYVATTSATLYQKSMAMQMMGDNYFRAVLAAEGLIYCTEGINYVTNNDNLQRFYTTPDFVTFNLQGEIGPDGVWWRVKEVADTGQMLDLGYTGTGILSNMASANSNTQFEFTNQRAGGKNTVLINSASEPTISDDAEITAGSFVVGKTYTIKSVGTTDFTAIGASSNTVGVVFTATGVGSGTGTASENATKIKGSDFQASTDMYMVVWYNGNRVEFWFEQIAP